MVRVVRVVVVGWSLWVVGRCARSAARRVMPWWWLLLATSGRVVVRHGNVVVSREGSEDAASHARLSREP